MYYKSEADIGKRYIEDEIMWLEAKEYLELCKAEEIGRKYISVALNHQVYDKFLH